MKVWHLLSFVTLVHWNDPQSHMHLLRLSSIYIGVCWSMHSRGYRVWRLQVLPAGAFCLAAGTHEHLGFGFLICTLAAVYPKHQATSSRFIVGKQQSIAKLWSLCPQSLSPIVTDCQIVCRFPSASDNVVAIRKHVANCSSWYFWEHD